MITRETKRERGTKRESGCRGHGREGWSVREKSWVAFCVDGYVEGEYVICLWCEINKWLFKVSGWTRLGAVLIVCASTHSVEPTCSSSHACVCVRVCALMCLLACVQREVIILSLFRGLVHVTVDIYKLLISILIDCQIMTLQADTESCFNKYVYMACGHATWPPSNSSRSKS